MCDNQSNAFPCKARITISVEGEVVKIIGDIPEHPTHDPDIEKHIKDGVRAKLRKLCKEAPLEKLKNLLSDARGSITDEHLPLMPSDSSLKCIGKRGLKRMRIAEETLPVENQAGVNYTSIVNFSIPEKLLHHEDRGHNVLLLVSKTTDPHLERILVFGLPESFNLIRRACQIIMDGTFATCPLPFAQNYQFHVIVDGFILNVLQCLLPGKSNAHYLRLFAMLLRKCPELAQLLFIIDFEMAMILAIQEIFF